MAAFYVQVQNALGHRAAHDLRSLATTWLESPGASRAVPNPRFPHIAHFVRSYADVVGK
jgi:hypothetical protein